MRADQALPPSEHVIGEFGVRGTAALLPGGQGNSFAVENVVFKPCANVDEASWSANVLEGLQQEQFRVQMPVRARDGSWVVEGWVANRYLAGTTIHGEHFRERFSSIQQFHRSLSGVKRPDFLEARDDPWSIADRIVWGIQEWNPSGRIQQLNRTLVDRFMDFSLDWQVVHGDVSGNMLWQPGEPIGIIDFTPYWCPTGFGEAIFVVDAVMWEGADLATMLALGEHIREFSQLVIRAFSRRVLEIDTQVRAGFRDDSSYDQAERYKQVVGDFFKLV